MGALVVAVGFFLYAEFKGYLGITSEISEDKKYIETGTLVNLVYETDGLSKLALLTLKNEDYARYQSKSDSLYQKIGSIKELISNERQKAQLDSINSLFTEKNSNIEQLRMLKINNQYDSSLDDILREFKKLDTTMGKLVLENYVNNPAVLSKRERRYWQVYIDYLNSTITRDNPEVKKTLVDSMLVATRYIVREAKRQNSKARIALAEKENELIRNDLNISRQLRGIISTFDAEVNKNYIQDNALKEAAVKRTRDILKIAAGIGFIVLLLFTYIILTDFFKAERFRRNLKQEKKYSEDLLKSREQLISTVSHDLKTPLNTIVGYSGLIENTPLTEKQQYYIQQITSSSHYVNKLVDDLLDFSKLEAGKIPLEQIPFSLENLIRQVADSSGDIHSQKNVKLEVDIASSLQQRMFKGDPLRIQQILTNLIGNAFKFTEEGEISIVVKELQKDENSSKTNLIQIEVKDTGIGISKEKQELIFKEFTQAETDTATRFGGYGLGLAISKKLTELLSGSLKVKSILGEGSTFTVTLPLTPSEFIVTSPKAVTSENLISLKAVLIDDDASMTALLKELFEQLKIDTYTFHRFSDFKTAGITEFDFVLTDIQMPETSGFEILRALQNKEISSFTGQPVIAMTGSRDHTEQHFYDVGFSALLKKPFSKDALVAALHKVFPNRVGAVEPSEIQTSAAIANEHFDLTLLQSFLGKEDGLYEVLQVFQDQTVKDIQQLKKAIKTSDFETINAVSHRMLTMFRQICAVQVIPILEALEHTSTQTTTPEESIELFENLQVKIDELMKALKQPVS